MLARVAPPSRPTPSRRSARPPRAAPEQRIGERGGAAGEREHRAVVIGVGVDVQQARAAPRLPGDRPRAASRAIRARSVAIPANAGTARRDRLGRTRHVGTAQD